jgi:hypothetical protein
MERVLHPYERRLVAIERTLVSRFDGVFPTAEDDSTGTWHVDVGGVDIDLTELAVEINEAIEAS